MIPTSHLHEYQDGQFLISPHTICDSCGRNSGPVFQLTELGGPSYFHRNNEIPSGVDEESKLRVIENTETEIKRLNAEIERNQAVLASLQKRRDALKIFRDQEKSHFAPIRRLPDDLLRRVFLECQMDSGRNGYIHICDPNAFIRTVTRVCSYWGVVAYNLPDLWSRIAVYYDPDLECTRMVGPFLEMCVSLSREMPLNLKIDMSCTVGLLGDHCLQSIADCSPRWKDIKIDCGELIIEIMSRISPDLVFWSLQRLSLSDISHPFSLNRSPVLFHLDINFVRRDAGITISLMSAPSLRELSVERVNHPTSILVDLPYSQITTFKSISNGFFNDELSSILNSMPNLASFTVEGKSKILTPIMLRSLKKLTVHSEWLLDNANALDAFTAPNLDTLHLETVTNILSIIEFLRRSGCSLTDFKLKGSSLTSELMTQLPDVRKLCLVRSESILANLRLLTRNSHFPLPKLRSLEMVDVKLRQGSADGDHILGALIDMVQSRITPAGMVSIGTESHLQSVTISFKAKLNSDQKNSLLMFNRSTIVQSGIIMSVSHRQTVRTQGVSEWDITQDLLRNGVEVKENDIDSAETTN